MLKLDIEVAKAAVGRNKVEVGVNVFVDEAGNRGLAFQQFGQFAAFNHLRPGQVKTGSPLRVEIPEQGADVGAAGKIGGIHCRCSFAYATLGAVEGDDSHGRELLLYPLLPNITG